MAALSEHLVFKPNGWKPKSSRRRGERLVSYHKQRELRWTVARIRARRADEGYAEGNEYQNQKKGTATATVAHGAE